MTADNLLERAFMARVRSEEYAAELKGLQDPFDEQIEALKRAFDEREDVIALKRKIDRCDHERKTCIDQAQEAGIERQGSFILKVRRRRQRTIIPAQFFARHGAEAFIKCSTVGIGKAEELLGKGSIDDCCEVEERVLGATVEYERQEVRE
ncbi:MAG: hypothetical protein WC343_00255 [Bacilli bacterium]|jgi:hypothetical protein